MTQKNSSFDSDGIQFAWDSTCIDLAETCLYKYYLRMICRWKPVSGSPHLRFGGHYATACEHYHAHRAKDMSHDDAVEAVVLEALIDTWDHERDESGNRIPGTGQPWTSLHNLKTRENLIRTIIWYLDEFENDPAQTIILPDGKPAVELSFTLDIGDEDIVFCGHLDRFVEYSGDLYVMDQKTTGTSVTPYYFRQWDTSGQMSMYTFAGRMIYDIPLSGVIIDAAQIAVGFSRFSRGMTFRTDLQLQEWLDDARYHIAMAREGTKQNRFPMNRSSCTKYGGCEFAEMCAKDPDSRNNFLRAKFQQDPKGWDPLENR